MIKKLAAATLTILMLALPFFNGNIDAKTIQKENREEVAKDFSDFYEKYRDFDKAQEQFEKKYPQMVLIMDRSTDNSMNDSEFSIQSHYGDVDFNEAIYYSTDSQKYYYYGSWDASDLTQSDPWDMIGVSTTNKYSMPLSNEVIIRGYNALGIQKIYVNTALGTETGNISQGTDNADQEQGVGFWFDDYQGVTGTITAFLDDYDYSEEIQMQYNHSWTSRNVTGIGGNVDVKSGGGFTVTWDTNVNYAPPHYSYGTN